MRAAVAEGTCMGGRQARNGVICWNRNRILTAQTVNGDKMGEHAIDHM